MMLPFEWQTTLISEVPKCTAIYLEHPYQAKVIIAEVVGEPYGGPYSVYSLHDTNTMEHTRSHFEISNNVTVRWGRIPLPSIC